VGESNASRFPGKILVTALNEVGTLAQICQVIGDLDGNISNVHMTKRASDFYEMEIDLEVWDLKHLNRILAQLRRRPVVSKVARLTD
jgi:guanosine-3',5'-bis(diphosphate) 3'-pyrophosphohydrolase